MLGFLVADAGVAGFVEVSKVKKCHLIRIMMFEIQSNLSYVVKSIVVSLAVVVAQWSLW